MNTKMSIFLLAVFFILSFKINAQDNEYASINIYRPSSLNADKLPIFVNGKVISVLESNNEKLTYKTYEEGKYKIMVGHKKLFSSSPKPWLKTLITIDVDLGNDYYIELSASALSKKNMLKIKNQNEGLMEFKDIPKSELSIVEGEKPDNYANNISTKKNKNTKDKQKEKESSTSKSENSSKVKSDVDKNIPEISKKYSNKYALIIGNEDYKSYQKDLTTEQNVKYAVNDAKIFKKYSIKTLGIPEENIIDKYNLTASEMHRAVSQISNILKLTEGGAEIYFYYAGHGFPDPKTKEPYLIPVDVTGNQLSLALNLKNIYKKLTKYSAKKIIVFLDACFTGAGREASLMSSRGVKIEPKEPEIQGNMVVYSASSKEQSALPYKEKKHGLFTYYLLKKIKESKGNITLGKLKDYLEKEIPIRSTILNEKEQTPKVNIGYKINEEWKNWKLK